jgi:hypothetical protein
MMSTIALRQRASRLGVALVALALSAALAVLVGSIVKTLEHVKPVRATKPPVSAVVWGTLVFQSPDGLNLWLRRHGVAYPTWARRHPPANRLLRTAQTKTRDK